MKQLILFLLIILSFDVLSQDINKIQKDFNDATLSYEKGDYFTADSLFTEVIHEYPNKGAFFNRALSKKGVGNMNAYCQDLQIAALLYEENAMKLVCEECYRIVTNYYDKENQLTTEKDYKFKEVIKIMKYDTLIYVRKTSKSGILKSEEIINEFVIKKNKKDTIKFVENGKEVSYKYNRSDTTKTNVKDPEFIGGNTALMEYMQSVMKYPKRAKRNEVQSSILIYFEIDKNGYVVNVKPLQFLELGFTEEAVKAIVYMPRWKPGTKNGKPVSVKFTYPIKFKLL
jgi:hypothetical protein